MNDEQSVFMEYMGKEIDLSEKGKSNLSYMCNVCAVCIMYVAKETFSLKHCD